MSAEINLGIEGLGDYQEVGRGGFAVVYSATQTAFNRRVAVKVLDALDDAGIRRFNREQMSMGVVDQHPNIVTPFNSGFTSPDQKPYLMMEYLSGGSLQDRLDRYGRIEANEAISLTIPIASALGHSHRSGLVHKDVKPANILVSSTGVSKLTDFGIAALRESTATASLAYSLAYSAPETFSISGSTDVEDPRDERSDLYSLAATLYTLVAGHDPFKHPSNNSPAAYMARIMNQAVPLLGHHPLDAFLAKAMAKNPYERYQSAAEFADALEAARVNPTRPFPPAAPAPVASGYAASDGLDDSSPGIRLQQVLALAAVLVALVAGGLGLRAALQSPDSGDALPDPGGSTTSQTDPPVSAGEAEVTEPEVTEPQDEPSPPASSLDVLNVAYFSGWPTPNQIGQTDGTFGDAVGVPINWIPYPSGGAMTDAMENGDVDIAYSQGFTPFANAVNEGADIRLVGAAVSYPEADNCVARGDLGVTRDNAPETLAGATVMTPTGNVSHYKMLSMMEFLGVDVNDLNIVQAEGGIATAAALEGGTIDVGCAFGESLVTMLDQGGNLIMTGAEVENEIGIYTYDVVSIPTSFGQEHPDVVTSFLRAMQTFNDRWAADPTTYNPTIASAADLQDVGDFLAGRRWFVFPSVEEQLGPDWLGGRVQQHMRNQLLTFERLGLSGAVIDDFDPFVDTSFLAQVN